MASPTILLERSLACCRSLLALETCSSSSHRWQVPKDVQRSPCLQRSSSSQPRGCSLCPQTADGQLRRAHAMLMCSTWPLGSTTGACRL